MIIRFVAASLCLSGCATTYPLHLTVEETKEVFVGTARSSFVSDFDMTNAAGLKCTGTYDAPISLDPFSAFSVHGIMSCPDGRNGQWTITGDGRGGQGVGELGGKPIRVYFGNLVVNQQIER